MKVSGNYRDDGYALIEGLLPAEVGRAFLNQLYVDVAGPGGMIADLAKSSPVLKRDAIEIYGYHYPPMLMLLWGLTPIVAELTGRDLLPTYDYFRIYREDDICRVHSDRPSCEHSLSLTIDYSDGVPWDLEIGTDRIAEPSLLIEEDFGSNPFRSMTMNPGDALLYEGVHHRHGRVTPNPNAWSAHLFLHWVDREGPYAAHAFDGNAASAKPLNLRLD